MQRSDSGGRFVSDRLEGRVECDCRARRTIKKTPHSVFFDPSSELDAGSRSGQDIGGAVDVKPRVTRFAGG